MKKYFLVLVLCAVILGVSNYANASTRVSGYMKKSGTYVMPHYRSSVDSSRLNNWSTKGNYNPYTGKKGTKSLYKY